MKKLIIVLFFIVLILCLFKNNYSYNYNDIIRYRIIANDNSKEAQDLKMEINEKVVSVLDTLVSDSNSKEEARKNIINNLDKIDDILNDYDISYQIKYGDNYFPEKEYHDLTFKEGEYESLAIYLDDANGDNFWCVLFPPLCNLDLNQNNMDNVTYDLYFKNIINKYL